MVHLGHWGPEIPAHKVGLGGRLWEQICRLRPGWSSRGPAAGGKLEPPNGRRSPDTVEISRLARPMYHISEGTLWEISSTLIILTGPAVARKSNQV